MPKQFEPFRGSFFCAAALFALAGCAARPEDPTQATQPITLESAFMGDTLGRGRFSVPIAGVERTLTAKLHGYRTREGFAVDEDFVFNDGERNRLTWRFVRTGPTTWSGKREDTVGEARITEANGSVRFEYTADVRSGGSLNRLEFSDLLFGTPNGGVTNRAVVRKSGIPVGTIEILFQRVGR